MQNQDILRSLENFTNLYRYIAIYRKEKPFLLQRNLHYMSYIKKNCNKKSLSSIIEILTLQCKFKNNSQLTLILKPCFVSYFGFDTFININIYIIKYVTDLKNSHSHNILNQTHFIEEHPYIWKMEGFKIIDELFLEVVSLLIFDDHKKEFNFTNESQKIIDISTTTLKNFICSLPYQEANNEEIKIAFKFELYIPNHPESISDNLSSIHKTKCITSDKLLPPYSKYYSSDIHKHQLIASHSQPCLLSQRNIKYSAFIDIEHLFSSNIRAPFDKPIHNTTNYIKFQNKISQSDIYDKISTKKQPSIHIDTKMSSKHICSYNKDNSKIKSLRRYTHSSNLFHIKNNIDASVKQKRQQIHSCTTKSQIMLYFRPSYPLENIGLPLAKDKENSMANNISMILSCNIPNQAELDLFAQLNKLKPSTASKCNFHLSTNYSKGLHCKKRRHLLNPENSLNNSSASLLVPQHLSKATHKKKLKKSNDRLAQNNLIYPLPNDATKIFQTNFIYHENKNHNFSQNIKHNKIVNNKNSLKTKLSQKVGPTVQSNIKAKSVTSKTNFSNIGASEKMKRNQNKNTSKINQQQTAHKNDINTYQKSIDAAFTENCKRLKRRVWVAQEQDLVDQNRPASRPIKFVFVHEFPHSIPLNTAHPTSTPSATSLPPSTQGARLFSTTTASQPKRSGTQPFSKDCANHGIVQNRNQAIHHKSYIDTNSDIHCNNDSKNNNINNNHSNTLLFTTLLWKPQSIFQIANNYYQKVSPVIWHKCPWCYVKCPHLYAFLKHLHTFHSRFAFGCDIDSDQITINVRVLEDNFYETTLTEDYTNFMLFNPYKTNANKKLLQNNLSTESNFHLKHLSYTEIFSTKIKEKSKSMQYTKDLSEFFHVYLASPSANLKDSSQPSKRFSLFDNDNILYGHNRIYFRSSTYMPLLKDDFDYDSESEPYPEWLVNKRDQLIDEFTDVDDHEKEFMKMWNRFMMSSKGAIYIGECHMFEACQQFLKYFGSHIKKAGITSNLIFHICQMYHFDLITSSQHLQLWQSFLQSSTTD